MTKLPDQTLRTETFPYGIASVGLSQVSRQVPSDEPPPLPPNADLLFTGKPVPRQNGRAKVTGAIHYTADINLPGMLYGKILRSPLPHAELQAIDTSAAEHHPGVRSVMVLSPPSDLRKRFSATSVHLWWQWQPSPSSTPKRLTALYASITNPFRLS